MGLATLYLADCRDVLPLLQDVRTVIADPPYGIAYKSNHNSGRRGEWAKWVRDTDFAPIAGDEAPFDPTHLLNYERLILWGGNYYSARLPQNNCWLAWDKRESIASNDQADCELAWTNLPGPPRLFHHLWSGLIRRGEENVSRSPKLHPNQKPVALMDWCLQQACVEAGETICDPYMGSASLGIACLRRDVAYVGIEIDERHFEVACRRIEDAQRQGSLFMPANAGIKPPAREAGRSA